MEKYNVTRILVPLDETSSSKRGLVKAIFFARQCQATILGMHVIPIPTYGGYYGYKLNNSYRYDIKKIMANAKITCAKKGIDFKSKITYGDPGEEMINFAHNPKNRISLIVIGTRGNGITQEVFLGSTSNHLVHKSKVPVLIVR